MDHTEDTSREVELPSSVPSDIDASQTQSVLVEEGDLSAMEGNELSKKAPPGSPLQDSLRRLTRDYKSMVSLGVIVFFILLAIFGPPIYQHIGGLYKSTASGKVVGSDQYHTFYHQEEDRLDEGSSAQYWLGTDSLGRDQLARLMQGLLISIFVAFLVQVVRVIMGVGVGVLAGYYGGWIDQVLARIMDLLFAFPGLLFVILVTGIFGSWADNTLDKIPIIGENGNARLLLISAGLAFVEWPGLARLVRGQTLQLKGSQFIEAARTAGTSDIRIIVRHIVPNLFSIVVVVTTLGISNVIISEAGLSLLGLGVKSPGSSLGLMIADGITTMSVYPLEIIVPTFVLACFVLAFSFLGDGLRDAFDPRTKD